jgi:hypothetical protein
MLSLNEAEILLLVAAPTAPGAGTVIVTVGRVVSLVAAVVKLHTTLLASGMPRAFCAPVVTVAMQVVLGGRATFGTSVAVFVVVL